MIGSPVARCVSWRLAVCVAVVAAAGLALGAFRPAAAPDRAPDRAAHVTLLYLGADDCAPCRAWQHDERADFLASGEFAGINYREVKARRLHELLSDEHWPPDLRRYRDRLRPSDGVPLWLVIADEEVVDQRFGLPEWRNDVLPKIRSILR